MSFYYPLHSVLLTKPDSWYRNDVGVIPRIREEEGNRGLSLRTSV